MHIQKQSQYPTVPRQVHLYSLASKLRYDDYKYVQAEIVLQVT